MGVYNSEIFNNIGLCCFFAQQYDMALSCFERALSMASDENMADIWYNISHVAIVSWLIYASKFLCCCKFDGTDFCMLILLFPISKD